MLDQLIAVSGTIVAAIIGFIALIVSNAKSNRHALELEKLRIEAEESKDKAKRHATMIEEVYTLLTNINAQISENIDYARPTLEGKPLQDDMRRLQALIYLYFPSLKEKLDEFMKSMFRLASKVNDEQKGKTPPQVWKNVKESYSDFNKRLYEIKAALEKMVK